MSEAMMVVFFPPGWNYNTLLWSSTAWDTRLVSVQWDCIKKINQNKTVGDFKILKFYTPMQTDASICFCHKHAARRIQQRSENTRVCNLKILGLTKCQSGGRIAEQTDCLSPRGLTGHLAPSVQACQTTYPLVSLREETQTDWILV